MEPELPDLPNKPTRLVSYCPSEEKFTVEDGHTDEAMRSYGLQCYRMGVEAERERCAALAQSLRDLLVRIKVNGGLGEYKGGPAFAVQNAMDALAAIRGTDTE